MKPFAKWKERFDRFEKNVKNFPLDEILSHAADEVESNYEQAIYSGLKRDIVGIRNGYVTLSGDTAFFIEFGTGVSNEEHIIPMYHHGTYGKGGGASEKGWVYRGTAGNNPENKVIDTGKVRTWGEPAQMPVYKAYLDCIEYGNEKLKEVVK